MGKRKRDNHSADVRSSRKKFKSRHLRRLNSTSSSGSRRSCSSSSSSTASSTAERRYRRVSKHVDHRKHSRSISSRRHHSSRRFRYYNDKRSSHNSSSCSRSRSRSRRLSRGRSYRRCSSRRCSSRRSVSRSSRNINVNIGRSNCMRSRSSSVHSRYTPPLRHSTRKSPPPTEKEIENPDKSSAKADICDPPQNVEVISGNHALVSPSTSAEPLTVNLDDEALEILGEDPTKSKGDKNQLHPELLVRWTSWILSGLEKETKIKLLEKYECNSNLRAQLLNPELIHLLSEQAVKRDSYFINTQNLIGSTLTSLGLAINHLLANKEMNRALLLEMLHDTGKLLYELHFEQMHSRKSCIFPMINKNLKLVLQKVKSDENLFGKNLSEKIKETKVMVKMSSDLKITPVKRLPTKSFNFYQHSFKKNLNTNFRFHRKNSQKKDFPVSTRPTRYQTSLRTRFEPISKKST